MWVRWWHQYCIFVYIRKHELGICMCLIFQTIFLCPSFIYKPALKATHTFVTIKKHVLLTSNFQDSIWISPILSLFILKKKNTNSVGSNIVWYETIMTCNCFVVKGDVFLFLVQMLMWAPSSLSHSLYMYTHLSA